MTTTIDAEVTAQWLGSVDVGGPCEWVVGSSNDRLVLSANRLDPACVGDPCIDPPAAGCAAWDERAFIRLGSPLDVPGLRDGCIATLTGPRACGHEPIVLAGPLPDRVDRIEAHAIALCGAGDDTRSQCLEVLLERVDEGS